MAGYGDVYGDVYESEDGSVQTLDGTLFLNTPLFPVGQLIGGELTLTGVLFESAPLFPVGALIYGQIIEGVLFQSAPFFPLGVLQRQLIARPFTMTVTFNPRSLVITGVQSIMTVGETSVPQATFRDADGLLYDPDLVTVRLRDPSGVETFPTVIRISTGIYQAPFLGTEVGVWRGWIRGEGPGTDLVIEQFSVCFVEDE